MHALARSFVCAALLSLASAAHAQTPRPATARLEDAAWLAGRWVGEGLGGHIEETWAPPAAGQMVGHFRLWSDGEPQIYELMLMDVVDGALRMRVRHFNSDFTAWEEKDEWHTFEFVSATPEALSFRGLEIRRDGPDHVLMILQTTRAGAVGITELHYRRAPL